MTGMGVGHVTSGLIVRISFRITPSYKSRHTTRSEYQTQRSKSGIDIINIVCAHQGRTINEFIPASCMLEIARRSLSIHACNYPGSSDEQSGCASPQSLAPWSMLMSDAMTV